MAQWTREQQLAFDIAFGLKKVTIPGFRKALKEEDRFASAARINDCGAAVKVVRCLRYAGISVRPKPLRVSRRGKNVRQNFPGGPR